MKNHSCAMLMIAGVEILFDDATFLKGSPIACEAADAWYVTRPAYLGGELPALFVSYMDQLERATLGSPHRKTPVRPCP